MKMEWQTVKTLIRLLLEEEQSDLDMYCLLIFVHVKTLNQHNLVHKVKKVHIHLFKMVLNITWFKTLSKNV